MTRLRIERATAREVPLILRFIKELAEYEKMLHGVTATEESLRETLFGPSPAAEALLAYDDEEPVDGGHGGDPGRHRRVIQVMGRELTHRLRGRRTGCRRRKEKRDYFAV